MVSKYNTFCYMQLSEKIKNQDKPKIAENLLQFIFFGKSLNCRNTCSAISNSSQNSQILINQSVEKQKNAGLIKITEIISKGFTIIIKDFFEDKIKDLNLNDDINKKKKKQFAQLIDEKNRNKVQYGQKNDVKNVVKNLIKIFLNWLSKQGRANYFDVFHLVNNFFENAKYNNSFALKIIQDSNFGNVFFQFCEKSANELIRKSKIIDKQSHYLKIKSYIKIYKEIQERKILQGIIQ